MMMGAGHFTWNLISNVSFEGASDDAWMVTEICSSFDLANDGGAPAHYHPGNAHRFILPDNARLIEASESVRMTDGTVYEHPSPTTSRPRIVTCDNQRDVLVHPVTLTFKDVKKLQVCLTFRTRVDLRPNKEKFHLPWKFSCEVVPYLTELGVPHKDESLGHLELAFKPPARCSWNTTKAVLETQLIAGPAGKPSHCYVHQEDITIQFQQPQHVGGALNLSLDLGLKRSREQVELNFNSMREGVDAHDRETKETVVLFACDLRGSSEQQEGRPLTPKVQLFRAFWMNIDKSQFRQVKIIGDLGMAVLTRDQFWAGGSKEICRLVEEMRRQDMVFRGGFHVGEGVATSKPGDTELHWGEEFNGEVINHGSKVADFKGNDGGLIASREFMEWLRAEPPSGDPWKSQHPFGDWTTDLFRIDLRDLRTRVKPGPESAAESTERHFADRIVERAERIDSRLIVGLDPDVERFPSYLQKRYRANPTPDVLEKIIVEFHEAVIEATLRLAVAYKPQAAFYEQYGLAGLRALQQTIALLRDRDLPIILDAKRNDIAHTAKAYGLAWLARSRPLLGDDNDWRVDALTVNGYLGHDGIQPFLEVDFHAGLFVLAKTSNPSSGEFQDLLLKEKDIKNHEQMALLAKEWGGASIGERGYSRIGLVVGATYPQASKRLRELAPTALFLMPGVGAQGAGYDSVALGGGKDGFGAYAASSRSVLYGFDPERGAHEDTWRSAVAKASATEAQEIRDGVRTAANDQ
jgi:orotidine-5'-phosphate decarboxylase